MIKMESLTLLQSLLASKDVNKFLRKKSVSYHVLLILLHLEMHQGECLIMSELARHTCTSTAAITGLISRLVDQGYVDRNHDQRDRRKVSVVLTVKGQDLLKEYKECIEIAFLTLDEDQAHKLRPLLMEQDEVKLNAA